MTLNQTYATIVVGTFMFSVYTLFGLLGILIIFGAALILKWFAQTT